MQHSHHTTTTTTSSTKKGTDAKASTAANVNSVSAQEERLNQLPPTTAAEANIVGEAAVEDSNITYATNVDTNVVFDNSTTIPNKVDSKLPKEKATTTTTSKLPTPATTTATTATTTKRNIDEKIYQQNSPAKPFVVAPVAATSTTTTVATAPVTSPAAHLDRHDEHFTEEQRQQYISKQQTNPAGTHSHLPAAIIPAAAATSATTLHSTTTTTKVPPPTTTTTAVAGIIDSHQQHSDTYQQRHAENIPSTKEGAAHHQQHHLQDSTTAAATTTAAGYGNHHRTHFEKQPVADEKHAEECDRCEKHLKTFEQREGLEHGDKFKKFGEIPRSQQIDLGAHAGEEQHPTHFEKQPVEEAEECDRCERHMKTFEQRQGLEHGDKSKKFGEIPRSQQIDLGAHAGEEQHPTHFEKQDMKKQ